MDVFLDNNRVEFDAGIYSLKDIADLIARNELPPDRAIWNVTIDGVDMTDKMVSTSTPVDTQSTRKVVFQSIDGFQICSHFMEKAVSITHELCDSAQHLADLFRNGDFKEVNRVYLYFLDAYRNFLHAVEYTKSFIETYDNGDDRQKVGFVDQFQVSMELFEKMIASQEHQDWVSLADLLEYELVPHLKKWPRVMPTIN